MVCPPSRHTYGASSPFTIRGLDRSRAVDQSNKDHLISSVMKCIIPLDRSLKEQAYHQVCDDMFPFFEMRVINYSLVFARIHLIRLTSFSSLLLSQHSEQSHLQSILLSEYERSDAWSLVWWMVCVSSTSSSVTISHHWSSSFLDDLTMGFCLICITNSHDWSSLSLSLFYTIRGLASFPSTSSGVIMVIICRWFIICNFSSWY